MWHPFFVLFPDVLFHLMVYFWILSDYPMLEYEFFDGLKIFRKKIVIGYLVRKWPILRQNFGLAHFLASWHNFSKVFLNLEQFGVYILWISSIIAISCFALAKVKAITYMWHWTWPVENFFESVFECMLVYHALEQILLLNIYWHYFIK